MASYTIEQIEANIDDLIDFEEVGSVSRAKQLVTWLNRWIMRSPQSSSNQSSSLSMDIGAIERIKARALDYIAANETVCGARSSVNFLSVNHGFR